MSQNNLSRRKFIRDVSLGTLGVTTSKAFVGYEASPKKIKIAIVGAGLAGLRAANMLSKYDGLEVRLYEGSSRLGGRIYTDRNTFSSKTLTTVEVGGEFIDSDHTDIWNIVKEFKLETLDTWKSYGQLITYDVFMNDKNKTKQYNQLWSDKWMKLFVLEKQKLQDLNYKKRLDNFPAFFL